MKKLMISLVLLISVAHAALHIDAHAAADAIEKVTITAKVNSSGFMTFKAHASSISVDSVNSKIVISAPFLFQSIVPYRIQVPQTVAASSYQEAVKVVATSICHALTLSLLDTTVKPVSAMNGSVLLDLTSSGEKRGFSASFYPASTSILALETITCGYSR